jgi:DNA-binding response OmpR family regulator
MQATRILVVDDDPIQLIRLSGVLGSQYQVDTLATASGLDDKLAQQIPDLIILDIELPDGDGISLCRGLRSRSALEGVPIVFHSAHDSLDERMAAYEAGGDDFFLKTLTAQELTAKVAVLLDWVSRNRTLEQDRRLAEQETRAAKGGLGEFTIALEALRRAGTARDLQSLAETGVDALSDWRIDANVQVRAGKQFVTLNPRGQSTPLEVSIIHNSRLSGPQFAFRDRLVLNFPQASILIRNMPLDDAVQAQRVRDLASILGEALDARARALDNEMTLQARNAVSLAIAEEAEAALRELQTEWRQRHARIAEALKRVQEALERDFLKLSLHTAEEAAIFARLNQGMDEVNALFTEPSRLDARLSEIKARLERNGRAA